MEKTWVTDGNRAVPTPSVAAEVTKYQAWYYKSLLTNTGLGLASNAGAWSVVGSSDSSTASATDLSDRWTTTFTLAKLVQAAPGSAHSWIVLKSPSIGGVNYYLVINFVASTSQLEFYFSKTAPSGGSTTARPTASDEYAWTAQTVNDATTGSSKVHGNLATDGNFVLYWSKDARGWCDFGLIFHVVTDTHSGDANPAFTFAAYNSSTPGAFSRANWTSNAGNWKGRSFDNTTAAVNAAMCTLGYGGGTHIFANTELGTVDSTDSKYDDYPAYIYVYTSGHKSKRGRVADVLPAPESAAQMSVEPTSGPPYNSAIIGNLWHPWTISSAPSF